MKTNTNGGRKQYERGRNLYAAIQSHAQESERCMKTNTNGNRKQYERGRNLYAAIQSHAQQFETCMGNGTNGCRKQYELSRNLYSHVEKTFVTPMGTSCIFTSDRHSHCSGRENLEVALRRYKSSSTCHTASLCQASRSCRFAHYDSCTTRPQACMGPVRHTGPQYNVMI